MNTVVDQTRATHVYEMMLSLVKMKQDYARGNLFWEDSAWKPEWSRENLAGQGGGFCPKTIAYGKVTLKELAVCTARLKTV